jgi:hypothetical protein
MEWTSDCLDGGLHCVGDSGCQLCYRPTFGAINVGNRPVCERFALLDPQCSNDSCCVLQQNPNPTDGNGFLEFDPSCLPNGGLHCISNTGCRYCYKPTLGGFNVGDRPICTRFAMLPAAPFTFPPVCISEQCCIDAQNPNHQDGNGFLEYSPECKPNGGLHCVHNGGCSLCYKPTPGGVNVGNRPICERYLNLLPICSDLGCCLDNQNPNLSDGNGFMEFDPLCLSNGGGLHCVHTTGCSLCYKPTLGGVNIGPRPICLRFV